MFIPTTNPIGKAHCDLVEIKTAAANLEDQIRRWPLQDATLEHSMRTFAEGLTNYRNAVTSDEWKTTIYWLREQELASLLREDPYVSRCWTKPRGYPGDAGLLDLIYRHSDSRELLKATTDRGRRLYEISSSMPSAEAVRERKKFLANQIDATCKTGKERIFAVACGYLRELEISSSYSRKGLKCVMALDQDPDCILKIQNRFPGRYVNPTRRGIKELCRSKSADFSDLFRPEPTESSGFALIYSAGLFDYLDDQIASSLLRGLIESAAPGGKILVANFLPKIVERGFMEAFMDWWLIYRTLSDLEGLLSEIPSRLIDSVSSYTNTNQSIAYLEIVRA